MSDWEKAAGQLAMAGLPSLGSLIGGVAGSVIVPGLGTAAGSSVGGALGKAAATAIGATLNIEPTPEAIAAKVAENPDAAKLALARVEADAKVQLGELQDVANARTMLVDLSGEHASSQLAPATLSLVAVVGFFALLITLMAMRTDPPTAIGHLVDTALGAVIILVKQVYDFWFGSSRSSQRKDVQLGAMISQAANGSGR